MRMLLVVHIVAGGLGLVAGFAALYAAKGARMHRKSGVLFVYAMVAMGLSGALIAALTSVEVSVIAGLTATYLVVTALTTVRPPTPGSRRIEVGAVVVGLAVGLTGVMLGFSTLASPDGTRDGLPAFPFFILGLPALLGGLSDIRWLRAGGLKGASRLVRHLWRMSYALLIAALSFFLGQADEFPEALRHPALLALPVLAVPVTMLYWLWRVRIRRSFRGIVAVGTPET